jgi:hypothetical protein
MPHFHVQDHHLHHPPHVVLPAGRLGAKKTGGKLGLGVKKLDNKVRVYNGGRVDSKLDVLQGYTSMQRCDM